MALLLRNHEIRGLMNMAEYITAVEDGYREVGLAQGAAFPRENLWIEGEADPDVSGGHLRTGSKASFKFKAALLPGLGGAGVQAYTAGLGRGLETFMFLFDARSGALAAILEVLYYDWLKTAAVAAVAADRLAREGSNVVALFGTGRHARSQLHGLRAVRPIERVQAYSRKPEARQAFCRKMIDELGIEVVAAATPAEALQDADIVTTITNSPTPVFDGTMLPQRHLHINAMGAHYPWVREIDELTVLQSRVFVDEIKQGLREQGEILIPMAEGRIDESHVRGDLGGLVAGRISGRNPETRWTLFLSGGTGIEDVAVATRLVEKAKEKGVGTEFAFNLPYDFEF
jgi:ornithine cyclodeaminase/alanine dehydrogenase-like protein (mu-crystallin family)